MTSDPLGLNAGLNTYRYVDGNSLVNSDKLGLLSLVVQAGGTIRQLAGTGILEGSVGLYITLYNGRLDFGFYSQGELV